MKPKILYVGPVAFNSNSWKTRAAYIFPDLFAALDAQAELYLATGPVPEFAVDSLITLCKRFSIVHFEVAIKPNGVSQSKHWESALTDIAHTIKPDVITNSFGAQWLGEVIVNAAAPLRARAVIRVAGDEIGSRLALGLYKNSVQQEADLATERAGFVGADTIIAMSPWEKARIAGIQGVAADKVKVCIRGVDLVRFFPRTSRDFNVRRFLYVGRRSAEKGYDLIEAAAQRIYQENPDIEFAFVGDFEPGQIENRQYLGWAEADDLPNLFRSVDAFILTSRTEGFPQVVAEAMASGLPCIVSEHLFEPLFIHGVDVLLTSLSSGEIVKQIGMLVQDSTLAQRLATRARQIAESSLDKNVWNRRYAAILLGLPFTYNRLFDHANKCKIDETIRTVKLPRIAFISPRVFGLMGTQGSYGLAKAFAKLTPTMVISKGAKGKGDLPVVANDEGLENHHRIDFSETSAAEEIFRLIADFRADIVHFVNDHCWVEFLPFLRRRYPAAKYVMDFKTPLLIEGEKRWWLQTIGQREAFNLDLVVSLSKNIALSWLPGYSGTLLISPLGIEVGNVKFRIGLTPRSAQKVRFIYIGQTHPKRKISKLLDLVAGLEPSSKMRFQLDIYGAGGGEAEMDAQIARLGLANMVSRKVALPQEQLFKLLTEYDCGIAWVPNDTYGQAPSLKFLEYAAAGLAIIATNTPAHQRNLQEGFQSPLFEENVSSFNLAVLKIMSGEKLIESIENNLKVVWQSDFGRIAKDVLLPAYSKLMSTNVENFEKPWNELPNKRLRLMFVSPRPLGLIATPGTYLSIEAYAEQCEIAVIAKPLTINLDIVVHTLSETFPVTLLDPQQSNYVDKVAEVIHSFQPDIVCVGSSPQWHTLAAGLRIKFPNVFMVLEIKSPVVSNNEEMLKRDRRRWQIGHHALDAIIAPSKGMVNSYIESIGRPFLQHRSILDYSAIAKKRHERDRVTCKKFLFAGSLSKHRQLDKLIRLIGGLPGKILKIMQLDIIGSGPAESELIKLSQSLGLNRTINFLGVLPQKELYQRYREYDAGIAWVPTELYDSAPSLKLIEYCASGLVPLATATSGHRLLEQNGFTVNYFDEDDDQSFLKAIEALFDDGFESQHLRKNIKLAEHYDFRAVIGDEIIPFYRSVKSTRNTARQQTDSLAYPAEASSVQSLNAASKPSFGQSRASIQQDLIQTTDIFNERALHARRILNS